MDVNARRTELDLPGTLKHELVGYPVVADSPFLRRGITPSWAKLTLVVRDDRVHTPEEAATVREGDHVYFLAPPDRVQALDRFFAERPPQASAGGRSGRGFLRAGRDHARRAGRDLRPGDFAGRRADAARGLLRALFHQARAAAERRPFRSAPVKLVAHTVTNDRVVTVGLQLADPEPVPRTKIEKALLLARRMVRRLRARLRRAKS